MQRDDTHVKQWLAPLHHKPLNGANGVHDSTADTTPNGRPALPALRGVSNVSREPPPAASDRSLTSSSTQAAGMKREELLFERDVVEAVFDALPMGVVMIDSYGIVKAYSESARRMFLYSARDVLQGNVTKLMQPTTAERHDYYLARARQRIEARLQHVREVGDADMDDRAVHLDDIAFETPETQELVANALSKMKMFGGETREVQAQDATGKNFAMELRVVPILLSESVCVCFLGYLTDIRHLTSFQNLTVKQEGLLKGLLDRRTLSRLTAGERTISDEFQCASVLFCDIVKYTVKANVLDPLQVVRYLNDVFGIFDKATAKNLKCMKIKTIGDCYMVASGVPVPVPDHAEVIVQLGWDFLTNIAIYNDRVLHGDSVDDLVHSGPVGMHDDITAADDELWRRKVAPLLVRMGAASGPMVGGIMSPIKGCYDIVGDTVNMASRLESSSQHMHLQISEATYNMLPEDLAEEFEFRQRVPLKGIGIVNTYLSKFNAFPVDDDVTLRNPTHTDVGD